MKRPYDLRHSGVTWRLNCGIPAPVVAKWAEVLTRIYTRYVAGLDDVWISRMDSSLGNGDNSAQRGAWLVGVARTCRSAWESVELCQT